MTEVLERQLPVQCARSNKASGLAFAKWLAAPTPHGGVMNRSEVS